MAGNIAWALKIVVAGKISKPGISKFGKGLGVCIVMLLVRRAGIVIPGILTAGILTAGVLYGPSTMGKLKALFIGEVKSNGSPIPLLIIPDTFIGSPIPLFKVAETLMGNPMPLFIGDEISIGNPIPLFKGVEISIGNPIF